LIRLFPAIFWRESVFKLNLYERQKDFRFNPAALHLYLIISWTGCYFPLFFYLPIFERKRVLVFWSSTNGVA
ncbi:MAG: hypothetical protein ABI863_19305, partial [Ginsengibacter sp.]